MKPLSLSICSLAVLAACGLRAERHACEVNVNVTLTAAGQKWAAPTKEKPVYYFPLVGGFHEEGAVYAGDKPPDRNKVLNQLAVAMAKAGYFVVGKTTPIPTVLLVFHWGSMNPETEDFGTNDPTQTVNFNQRQMLALVGANTLTALDYGSERDAVFQDAQDDRYFIVVNAYDFAAAQQKKKVLLWTAKMSTPSTGFYMDDVLSALVTTGVPHFGLPTDHPVRESVSLERKGTVKIDDFKVKEYLEPSAPTSKKP